MGGKWRVAMLTELMCNNVYGAATAVALQFFYSHVHCVRKC